MLWLLLPVGIILYVLGLFSGRFYAAVNILWFLVFMGTVVVIIFWLRHLNAKVENILAEKPNPKLTNKLYPVYLSELSRIDKNLTNIQRKVEAAEYNLLNQKARQAGESLDLLLKATTDNLTGLPNREQLDKYISKVFGRVIPLSVFLVDIDHFKKVNDTYGHDAGDKVLKKFAYTLKKSVRPADHVFRYGGEEFIIVANADMKEAIEISERVRGEVEKIIVPWQQQLLSITASFGVAQYRKGDTPESLIKRADEALYKAKQNGRNRVEGEIK